MLMTLIDSDVVRLSKTRKSQRTWWLSFRWYWRVNARDFFVIADLRGENENELEDDECGTLLHPEIHRTDGLGPREAAEETHHLRFTVIA